MSEDKFKEVIDITKKNISDTFCVLPWMHLNVQPNGGVFNCCMAPHDSPVGNTKDDTLEEVWNNFHMKTLRKKMLKGEKSRLCERCHMMEDNGVASPRNTFNEYFEDQIPNLIRNTDLETGHNHKFVLKYWDFRWSNICNFKCRMCGTFASSKWVEDELAIHGHSFNGLMDFQTESKEDIFKHVDKFIHEVEEIYFAGGEPLIMEEHYTILEKLIAAGRTDVRLRYNTNFSYIKFKKWDLEKLWQPFLDDPKGAVQLFASLDAVGKLAEVARNGTKWNIVYNNVKTCVDKGMQVHIAPTLSTLNIFHIPELLQTAFDLGIPEERITCNNFLTSPSSYDIRILPDELKEQVLDILNEFIDKHKDNEYRHSFLNFVYNAWTSFLYSDYPGDLQQIQIARREFLRQTVILDRRRKENFLEVNPQYNDWFKELHATLPNYDDPETFFEDRYEGWEKKDYIPNTTHSNEDLI